MRTLGTLLTLGFLSLFSVAASAFPVRATTGPSATSGRCSRTRTQTVSRRTGPLRISIRAGTPGCLPSTVTETAILLRWHHLSNR